MVRFTAGFTPGGKVSSSSISHFGQPMNSEEPPKLGMGERPCPSTYIHKCPLNQKEVRRSWKESRCSLLDLNWSHGAFLISCGTVERNHLMSRFFPYMFSLEITALATDKFKSVNEILCIKCLPNTLPTI